MFRRELDEIVAPVMGNPVSDRPWPRRAICQGINAAFDVAVIPAVECGARDTQHIEGAHLSARQTPAKLGIPRTTRLPEMTPRNMKSR